MFSQFFVPHFKPLKYKWGIYAFLLSESHPIAKPNNRAEGCSKSEASCKLAQNPLCYYRGKFPVRRMWSKVRRKPYLFTAVFAALNPPPYAGDTSWAIWCMKNSPSFCSTIDFPPFLEDEDDDEEEAVDVDGMFFSPGITSDSSHMYESIWQMPSSTSGLRLR